MTASALLVLLRILCRCLEPNNSMQSLIQENQRRLAVGISYLCDTLPKRYESNPIYDPDRNPVRDCVCPCG